MIERPFPDAAIDQASRNVDELARQAYEQFLKLLDLGVAPQDAIREVRAEFDQRYYEELAAAFEAILSANWTVAMVRQYQVSGVTLSRLLYEHWRTTSAEVSAIIRDHARGVQQARELAKALYEGYGFRGVEPLKVRMGNFRTLPKALRALATEPAVRATLMQAARRVAEAKLATASLRSAYTQAFDAAIAGASRERLQKLLRVAVYEKSRYFSERIAQTELARVHSDAIATEIMADPLTEVVQWRLSGAHPREDICDVFANVDRYGLGPGCFPKGQAPKPPAHPFCLLGSAQVSTGGGIASATRRWYDGDVIVIGTASGKRLEATVNHPVLTPSGWVAAGLLDVGDDVIQRIGPERLAIGHDNHKNVPASIAEIFDALGSSPEVATVEVPTSAPDFHGDGMAGQVAVVRANRKLWDGPNAALLQRLEDRSLVVAVESAFALPDGGHPRLPLERATYSADGIVSVAGQRDALLASQPIHADTLGLGATAHGPVVASEDGLHSAARKTEPTSNRQHGFHGIVAGENLPFESQASGTLPRRLFLRRWLRAQLDSMSHESALDGDVVDADLARDLVEGISGEVAPDRVVLIERFEWHDWVYNLETTTQHYTANGIVTHNCRCRVRTRPDLSAHGAKERPESEREYLRSLGDKRGARVLGSEHRLRQAVRSGDSLAAYNRGKDPEYAVKTLAQAVKEGKD